VSVIWRQTTLCALSGFIRIHQVDGVFILIRKQYHLELAVHSWAPGCRPIPLKITMSSREVWGDCGRANTRTHLAGKYTLEGSNIAIYTFTCLTYLYTHSNYLSSPKAIRGRFKGGVSKGIFRAISDFNTFSGVNFSLHKSKILIAKM
jgi:hypothetical protein